jgi:hypothetical protein
MATFIYLQYASAIPRFPTLPRLYLIHHQPERPSGFLREKRKKKGKGYLGDRDGKDKINMIQVTQNGGTNVIIEFCFFPPLAVCWFQ